MEEEAAAFWEDIVEKNERDGEVKFRGQRKFITDPGRHVASLTFAESRLARPPRPFFKLSIRQKFVGHLTQVLFCYRID